MKKIYICGHVNHEQLQTTVQTFKNTTVALYQAGYTPVNIMQASIWDLSNPSEELATRIGLMSKCDEVFVLPCWNNDRLAQVELAAAIALNKNINYAIETIKPRQVTFYTN